MRSVEDPPLPPALRVMLVTDGRGDFARLERVVVAALDGGVRGIQVREHASSARAIASFCRRVLPMVERASGVLIVNDRADVVAAGLAHGVHLGHRSLPPDRVREFLRDDALIGFSAHDPDELEAAASARCDYATLSPVFPTTCKPGADVLGPELAREWSARARLPVLWLGGIDVDHARSMPEYGPAGIAVRSALCEAEDVRDAAMRLVDALGPPPDRSE